MAKLLLVIPVLPERSYPGKAMGPDYLAASLTKNGHTVKIIDLDLMYQKDEPEETIINRYISDLLSFNPDIVGITNLSIQNDIANYFAYLTKKVSKKFIVIKGGVHETVGWKYTLELHHEYVDACVVGEGEEAIVEIANSVDLRKWETKKTEIKGVAYWDGNKPIFNGPSSAVDINEIIPERQNFDEKYNFDVFDKGKKQTAQMMTMRGCPYQCNFCSESFLFKDKQIALGHKVRMRTLESLKKEFDILKSKGYEAIYFDDSTFTINIERGRRIWEELKERGFIWGCNTRVDTLPREIIKEMIECGCVYLFCGVESFIPETLLAMNKTAQPKKYLQNVEEVYCAFRENSLANSIFLIFGNLRKEGEGIYSPEKFEDVIHSLKKALELNPDYLSMNILRLLPEVPFSVLPEYAVVRPTGRNPIHAGHYDLKWYKVNGRGDLRTKHPIYRCFEGSHSVNSAFVDAEYAYKIISEAIKLVNRKNRIGNTQTKIVIDEKAYDFVSENEIKGKIQYEIPPFKKIPPEVEQLKILEEWEKILDRAGSV